MSTFSKCREQGGCIKVKSSPSNCKTPPVHLLRRRALRRKKHQPCLAMPGIQARSTAITLIKKWMDQCPAMSCHGGLQCLDLMRTGFGDATTVACSRWHSISRWMKCSFILFADGFSGNIPFPDLPAPDARYLLFLWRSFVGGMLRWVSWKAMYLRPGCWVCPKSRVHQLLACTLSKDP